MCCTDHIVNKSQSGVVVESKQVDGEIDATNRIASDHQNPIDRDIIMISVENYVGDRK